MDKIIAPRIAMRRSVTSSLKKLLIAEVGEDSTEAGSHQELEVLRESPWPNHRCHQAGNEKQAWKDQHRIHSDG